MEQGGVHPLQPAGPLVDEVLVEPHEHAGVEHVGGRDPRLGHPPIDEQLAQVAGVGPIGLGPTLLAAQRRRLRRLSDMRRHTRPHKLFDDIPPARTALQRERHVVEPMKPLQPEAQLVAVGGTSPARSEPRLWPGPHSRT